MRPLRALLIAAVLAAGCSERPRNNPFDPANPITHGRPQGFAAVASDGRVTLSWQAIDAPHLVGYRLQRKEPSDVAYADVAGTIPPNVSSLIDFPLSNYHTYLYRLFYVFEQGTGGSAAEDVASPSPVVPWLLQIDSGNLLRLSADGRRTTRIAASGLASPNRLAVDPAAGNVWVAETFGARVIVYDPSGATLHVLSPFQIPTAIAVDAADHTAWICDEGMHQIQHLAEDGSPVGLNPVVSGFNEPTGAAVDPSTRSVWVCDRLGGHVHKLTRDGVELFSLPLSSPARVAADSSTGDAWVTDFQAGKLYHVSSNGALLNTIASLSGPLGVAVDPRRGRIWMALGTGNAVVALHRDGSQDFRVDGVLGPRHLTLDLATGEAWVAATTAGELWRIAPDGSVTVRRGDLGQPVDVGLDPGPRP